MIGHTLKIVFFFKVMKSIWRISLKLLFVQFWSFFFLAKFEEFEKHMRMTLMKCEWKSIGKRLILIETENWDKFYEIVNFGFRDFLLLKFQYIMLFLFLTEKMSISCKLIRLCCMAYRIVFEFCWSYGKQRWHFFSLQNIKINVCL